MKREFDVNLPDFRDGLPQDGKGIDVLQVMEHMRRSVRDMPGFEVSDDIALSTFSFAKYLMWKDLTDRTDALRRNRVVKHLIDNPERAFEAPISRFRMRMTSIANIHPPTSSCRCRPTPLRSPPALLQRRVVIS